jgi:hypothetical protein
MRYASETRTRGIAHDPDGCEMGVGAGLIGTGAGTGALIGAFTGTDGIMGALVGVFTGTGRAMGVPPPRRMISMPEILAMFMTLWSAIVRKPSLTVATVDFVYPTFMPAMAIKSRLDSTGAPSTATLNTRCPIVSKLYRADKTG